MNISGNLAGSGNAVTASTTAYRTERNPPPAPATDTSTEASSLASLAGTTVPRRNESVAQVESELSRQLAVSQATGAEADGATPDVTTEASKRQPSAATAPGINTDQPQPGQPAPAETMAVSPPDASVQLAVAQYQAHQSLLETSSDLAGRRFSIMA